MMKRMAAIVASAVIAAGCGAADSGPAIITSLESVTSPSATMVNSGSWYSVEAWPHDGNPHMSGSFVVFSDAASGESRQLAADLAEGVWADILELFEIAPEMLHLPAGQEKVHIYLYQNRFPLDWGAKAYYGGVILRSPDHLFQSRDPADYTATITHELVHVLSNFLFGRYALWVDVWFFEGLAEAIAGGSAGEAIERLTDLEDLIANYGRTSPISIKQYSQMKNPDSGANFYYPMFRLAVEYLLDEEGLGGTPADARDLIIDAANGIPFDEAFEGRIGLSLGEYEQRFFDLMDEYLGE